MEKEDTRDPLGWMHKKPTKEQIKAFEVLIDSLPKEVIKLTKEQQLLQLQIDDLKNKKQENKNAFWRGVVASLIVGSITCVLTFLLSKCNSAHQDININLNW